MIGPQYSTNMFHTYERYPANPRAYDHEARAVLWERSLEILEELRHEEVVPGVFKAGAAGGMRSGGVGKGQGALGGRVGRAVAAY